MLRTWAVNNVADMCTTTNMVASKATSYYTTILDVPMLKLDRGENVSAGTGSALFMTRAQRRSYEIGKPLTYSRSMQMALINDGTGNREYNWNVQISSAFAYNCYAVIAMYYYSGGAAPYPYSMYFSWYSPTTSSNFFGKSGCSWSDFPADTFVEATIRWLIYYDGNKYYGTPSATVGVNEAFADVKIELPQSFNPAFMPAFGVSITNAGLPNYGGRPSMFVEGVL